MISILDVSRHWARQSDKGKGIRLEADAVDLLNAIGVGELIMAKAAADQREAASARTAEARRVLEGDGKRRPTEDRVAEAARRARRATGHRNRT